MTVLNFPASPAVNDTYTENNVTYTWNGSYWDANNTGSLDDIYVEVAGDVMTGNLQLPGGGGNTAALQKQEITDLPISTFDNDSGYITSSDIPPGTVSYWKKDGSDLKPVSDTDNVNIGDGIITLNTSGSVQIGDIDISTAGGTTGVKLFAGGTINTKSDSINSEVYRIYNNESTTPTLVFTADGTVTANSFITSKRLLGVETSGGNNAITAYDTDATNYSFLVRGDGTTSIGGVIPNDPNITLAADGTISASRASFNNITNPTAPIVSCYSSDVYIADISTAGLRIGGTTTVPKALIDTTGSAIFKGTVQTAGGVVTPSMVLQLEADDPTKYTTDLDEEGNETQTYIGATLDVQESIETAVAARQAMRETFQELLVAVQSATDFGELKSAMLVALEDYA